jgi:hypothetical protein
MQSNAQHCQIYVLLQRQAMQSNAMHCQAKQCTAMQGIECNAKQCTTTRCHPKRSNAMQGSAKHRTAAKLCNASTAMQLLCTAAMPGNATHSNAMHSNVMHCQAAQCKAPQCDAQLLSSAQQCAAALCNDKESNALHCKAQQCAAQHPRHCTAIRSNKPMQINVMHCHAKVCLLLTSILDELNQCYAMHCKAQQRKAKQCRTQQSMQLSNVHFGLVVSESHYTCKCKCTSKALQC